ncbi:hypothetical protein [Moorena sp. SIO3H5]|uniref:hypothetical protein n=1 Tax=Moorena sp. SIO3H5 TaxID=2607834 RepID=UPI0013BE087A|nr:hypothetical protein [Moorena sp. SIO3H5]NEO70448.1 hypothetical protein [Moorena sp. SIO3H5]
MSLEGLANWLFWLGLGVMLVGYFISILARQRCSAVLGVSTGLTRCGRRFRTQNPNHERLHQDRCGRRFRTQNPNHERLHQDT